MGQTVLVVDADAGARLRIIPILERAGYHVISTGTLADAALIVEQDPPDVIVTEVRLDGYNGLHLIATAQAPMRAVVLTAYADATIEADAHRFGADYLVKPVGEADLINAVQRQLSRSTSDLFVCARQNPRTELRGTHLVEFEGVTARLRDVSYGGACLEMPGAQAVPRPGTVALRCVRGVVPVYVAWERQLSSNRWLCGVAATDAAAPVWHLFVDETLRADANPAPGTP